MKRRSVLSLVALSFTLLLALTTVIAHYWLTGSDVSRVGSIKGVPPFEVIGGRIISYSEFVGSVKSIDRDFYLPSRLPSGYHLTAIWARKTPYGLGFPVIIVYSRNGLRDYRAREDTLVIEITKASPAPLKQYVKMGAKPIYDMNGRLIGVIFPNAYCPTCVSQRTLPLAIVKVGGLEYLISFRDADTLVRIVHSMSLFTDGENIK